MKKAKKILLIITIILVIGGLIALVVAVRSVHKQTICKELSINIRYNNADNFITEKQVRLLAESTGELENQPIDKIDISSLKKAIEKHPYAAHVDVKTSIDGVLRISLEQREALVRVFNQDGNSFYIDKEGVLLPVQKGTASRLITANGFIAQQYTEENRFKLIDPNTDSVALSTNPLFKIYKLALFISKDDFLKAFVEQIYINQKNEIEIIPKVGDQIIQVGDIDRLDEKFTYLKAFYHSNSIKGRWNKYAIISLKYKNQIVCSKK
jgi:cell division protein FtsQ